MECVILGQRRFWKRRVFLYEFYEGNLQGWLLYWGTPEDIHKKVLETGISLHRGSAGEHRGK
jgi:hypothetical protein